MIVGLLQSCFWRRVTNKQLHKYAYKHTRSCRRMRALPIDTRGCMHTESVLRYEKVRWCMTANYQALYENRLGSVWEGKALRAFSFFICIFLLLIGQHDCVTLLNGDPTVYPCVCTDESMAVFILIAVSEPTVINVITDVSVAIAAVFIIIVTTVITDVIAIIFLFSSQAPSL